jgi:hypothetical protein
MLPLDFHRRHLRRTSCVVLVAWAMALAAGVAHACQLQPHGLAAPASLSTVPDERPAHHHEAEPAPDHGHSHHEDDGDAADADAGKASCLKFCDDESSAQAKGKPASIDTPTPAVLARFDWAPALLPAAAGSMQRAIAQPAAQGPPLVIRFLRLTI